MNRADHHARAEQLLEQARTTPDQISRREILAEAQVHATLALSAPAGKGPPGPGRDEAADIKSTGAAHPGMPKDGGPVPGWPAESPIRLLRRAGFTDRRPEDRNVGEACRRPRVYQRATRANPASVSLRIILEMSGKCRCPDRSLSTLSARFSGAGSRALYHDSSEWRR